MPLWIKIILYLAWINLLIEFMVAYVIFHLYKKHGWFKGFYHDFKGCHIPKEDTILECGKYGLERHAICKFCGKGIKQNWAGDWL